MIISFTVQNYKSIKEETTLNFGVDNPDDGVHTRNIAYPDRDGKIPVLRSVGIWGPNASGKSNLLDALEALQKLVATSHKYELDKPIKEYQPFKLDSKCVDDPVVFELEFIGKDKLLYRYCVKFIRLKITSESLYFYPGAKPAKLFDRKDGIAQARWFGTKLTGEKAMSCLDNQCYLSVAAQNGNSSEQLKEAFRYIRGRINFIHPNAKTDQDLMPTDEEYIKTLSSLLAYADLGIELKLKKAEIDVKKLPKNLPESIKQQILSAPKYFPIFHHHGLNVSFQKFEESAGTRRLYDISPFIILGLNSSETFVLDEIDCQLHPRIVEMIIHLFHDEEINGRNPQLIFTSHNTEFMDENIFRRDQIWFTQKNDHGVTELTCLDEFNQVRVDTNFEKWYRDGRFEAIPEIQYAKLKKAIARAAEIPDEIGGRQ